MESLCQNSKTEEDELRGGEQVPGIQHGDLLGDGLLMPWAHPCTLSISPCVFSDALVVPRHSIQLFLCVFLTPRSYTGTLCPYLSLSLSVLLTPWSYPYPGVQALSVHLSVFLMPWSYPGSPSFCVSNALVLPRRSRSISLCF